MNPKGPPDQPNPTTHQPVNHKPHKQNTHRTHTHTHTTHPINCSPSALIPKHGPERLVAHAYQKVDAVLPRQLGVGRVHHDVLRHAPRLSTNVCMCLMSAHIPQPPSHTPHTPTCPNTPQPRHARTSSSCRSAARAWGVSSRELDSWMETKVCPGGKSATVC